MSDILVVKSNIALKPDKLLMLRQHILEQKNNGVVVLPPYCTALIVPEDIEIRVENLNDDEFKSYLEALRISATRN